MAMRFRPFIVCVVALLGTIAAARADLIVYSKAEIDAIIASLPSGSGPATTSANGWKSLVEDYGAACDGVTDDAAAFAAAISDINAGLLKKLRIPILPGSGPFNPTKCRIGSQPPSITAQGFRIAGDGEWEAQLIRDYNGTNGVGLLNILGAAIGVEISDMTIASASGRSGGSAIYFQAAVGSGFTGAQTSLRNLNLTSYGTDSWSVTLWVNGSQKTVDPKGWRTLVMSNVLVFGANGYSAIFSSVVGLQWMGGGAFAAGGTHANTGSILVTGTATVPSTSIGMYLMGVNGVALDNCNNGIIESAIIGSGSGNSVTAAATADYMWVRGFRKGPTSLAWTNSFVNP